MLIWTDEVVERAASMRRAGFSSAEIGRSMGLTRNAVVGKLWRVSRAASGKVVPFKPLARVEPRTYSEAALTERWADRKARLARERAA